eukprot:SAG31_NODE_6378_length_2039_cov_3.455670_2_plen_550_part_01
MAFSLQHSAFSSTPSFGSSVGGAPSFGKSFTSAIGGTPASSSAAGSAGSAAGRSRSGLIKAGSQGGLSSTPSFGSSLGGAPSFGSALGGTLSGTKSVGTDQGGQGGLSSMSSFGSSLGGAPSFGSALGGTMSGTKSVGTDRRVPPLRGQAPLTSESSGALTEGQSFGKFLGGIKTIQSTTTHSSSGCTSSSASKAGSTESSADRPTSVRSLPNSPATRRATRRSPRRSRPATAGFGTQQQLGSGAQGRGAWSVTQVKVANPKNKHRKDTEHHQSITAMPQYKNQSVEEIMLEDYNKKKGQAAPSAGFSAAGSSSFAAPSGSFGAGATSAPSFGGFGGNVGARPSPDTRRAVIDADFLATTEWSDRHVAGDGYCACIGCNLQRLRFLIEGVSSWTTALPDDASDSLKDGGRKSCKAVSRFSDGVAPLLELVPLLRRLRSQYNTWLSAVVDLDQQLHDMSILLSPYVPANSSTIKGCTERTDLRCKEDIQRVYREVRLALQKKEMEVGHAPYTRRYAFLDDQSMPYCHYCQKKVADWDEHRKESLHWKISLA